MNSNYYIYFHKNPFSNSIFYVGLGKGNRAYDIKKGRGRTQHYINYINKYGKPIIEIVHNNITLDQARCYERFYIKAYGRVGYDINGILVNKSEGGESGSIGSKWSQESIDKRNLKLKGRKFTEEHKQKIAEAKKNHPIYKTRKSTKPITQKMLNGEIVKEWNSIKEAATSLGFGETYIINCCKGKRQEYKGFLWFYK